MDSNWDINQPYKEENDEGGDEVVGLIVEQVLFDTVVPSPTLTDSRGSEGGVRQEVRDRSERGHLNTWSLHHYY